MSQSVAEKPLAKTVEAMPDTVETCTSDSKETPFPDYTDGDSTTESARGTPLTAPSNSDPKTELSDPKPPQDTVDAQTLSQPPLPSDPSGPSLPSDSSSGPPLVETPAGPPLPNEPLPGLTSSGPPLPNEPLPNSSGTSGRPPFDDGWEYQWDYSANCYLFVNRFTGQRQYENPRVPSTVSGTAATGTVAASVDSVARGYNPAVHGNYDPNAWYAKGEREPDSTQTQTPVPDVQEQATFLAAFDKVVGSRPRPQPTASSSASESTASSAPSLVGSYFDVDSASAAHRGRSLRAERQNQRVSKAELAAYKERRKARKEEKRRAWLKN